MVPAVLSQLVLGLALLGVGLWARRSVDRLVPAHLDQDERRRRRRMMLRGAWACQVCAFVVIAMPIGLFLFGAR